MANETTTHRCDAGNECYDCYVAREAARKARGDAAIAALLASPVPTRCPHYTRDQGCPLHGETCHD